MALMTGRTLLCEEKKTRFCDRVHEVGQFIRLCLLERARATAMTSWLRVVRD